MKILNVFACGKIELCYSYLMSNQTLSNTVEVLLAKHNTSDAQKAGVWFANLVSTVESEQAVDDITLHALDASLSHFKDFVVTGDPALLDNAEAMLVEGLK